MNSQAGNIFGSSSDRVGIKGISEQLKLVDHDLKYYLLKNNTMQDVIISRFDNVFRHVQLNSPVKSINYSSDPVKITLEDGTEATGNKVIVTVPVPILKNGITFSPGLPAHARPPDAPADELAPHPGASRDSRAAARSSSSLGSWP